MWTSPDTFDNDLLWLKNHGHIVDLKTILNFDIPNDKPLFSITFDDGWIDNYIYAFPILKKHETTATIFLVTEAIETGHLFWVEDLLYKVALLGHDNIDVINTLSRYIVRAGLSVPQPTNIKTLTEMLAELLKPFPKNDRDVLLGKLYNDMNLDKSPLHDQIMSWDNIFEMSDYGIEFGSHTHTHEILQYASHDTVKKELEVSKSIIEEKLSRPVTFFCYPNARYRDDNALSVSSAGYKYAFRIHNRHLKDTHDKYFIPRFLMNEKVCKNKNYLICRLLGLPKF